MSKCSKIPSPHDIAHKSLRSGETVLWEGKPRHPFFIHRGDVWLEFIGVLFLLTLNISCVVDGSAWVMFFFLPLLFLAAWPGIRRYHKLRGAWYLITDQRVVTVLGWRLDSWPYPRIPYLERSKRYLGVTTLYLLPSEWCTRYTLWETTRGALVNLSDEDLEQTVSIINGQFYHKEGS